MKEEFFKKYKTKDIKDTKFKDVGIYALAVNKRLYIGKSNNKLGMRQRWLRHMFMIKKFWNKLNDISFESWEYVFRNNSSEFSGQHMYSKIVYALIDEGLDIEDIKFYVIESQSELFDNSVLEEKEKKYIDQFNTTFDGFNQFHSTVYQHYISWLYSRNKEGFLAEREKKFNDLKILIECFNEIDRYIDQINEKNFDYWKYWNLIHGLQAYRSFYEIYIEMNQNKIDFLENKKFLQKQWTKIKTKIDNVRYFNEPYCHIGKIAELIDIKIFNKEVVVKRDKS